MLLAPIQRCAILSGMLLVLSTPAFAAETLEQAWDVAIANNHRLKAAKSDTTASEQQLYAAQGQRLPEVKVSSGYTQFNETPAAQTQIEGQNLRFPTSQAGSANASAIASVPVYTFGRIGHAINAAEAALQAAHEHEAVTELDIKMQVADAYLAVLRAESGLKVAQSHVQNLAAHNKDAENLFDQGLVARNDLLAAQVELANAEQLAVQAANQLDIAKARYNQLLDRELGHDVSLAQRFPAMHDGKLDELTDSAFKQRPELAMLSQQIAALEQQSLSVKAEALPQVAVNGGFQYQENRYQAYQSLWTVNANVNWKLYDGSTRHQSDALIQQALSLKEQRDDLTSQITLQIRQAWLDCQETQKRLAVTEQAVGQAAENMKVTTDRYQQGLSTNTEVLKAEDLRIVSRHNFDNALYDAVLAALHLRYAVGEL